MRSSPAFPGCPSKGRPLLANAKHAGQYFRIRISFTLPQHGEVPERSNGEPLSLSGGDRGFESRCFQRRICLSWDFIFVVNNPGFPRGEPGKESGRLPGNYPDRRLPPQSSAKADLAPHRAARFRSIRAALYVATPCISELPPARVVVHTRSIIFLPCALQPLTALDRRRCPHPGPLTYRRSGLSPRCRSASSASSLRWSGLSRSTRR